MAVIISLSIGGLFTSALYWGTNDTNKTTFSFYSQVSNDTNDILNNGTNGSYAAGNSSAQNFQKIAERIQDQIATGQRGLQGNLVDQINAAFGIVSSLAMNIIFLLLSVAAEGLNMVAGITLNLMALPAPWNLLGYLFVGLPTTLIFVFVIFLIMRAQKDGGGIVQ